LLQLGFEGLGFDGSWMASLDGKLGWARLTDNMTYINEQRSINRWPCVQQVHLVVQLDLSQAMYLSGSRTPARFVVLASNSTPRSSL
jgi:hypothetical protein